MTCDNCLSFVVDSLAYREKRVVSIKSWTLSSIYYLGAFLLIVWIFGYMMIHNRGWEKVSRVESVVTTKLHGLAYTDNRIWDNAELMVPPKENGAFTVITSLLETQQKNGTCAEDPNVPDALCSNHSHCPPDQPVYLGNGVRTGECVNASHNSPKKVCEIRAWCPVEIDHPSKRIRMAHENFTVDIRNHVKFPLFQESTKNFDESMTAEELSTCTYDENHHKNRNCPVFKVATIVDKSNNNFEDMVQTGGVIEMVIEWDCTFGGTDVFYKDCRPDYSFYRLDENDPAHTKGFHLRYAEHYKGTDGSMERTLYRAYGIRVIVTVYGQGRKFDCGNFFFTIGSGLSYFAVVTFVISFGLGIAYRPCWPCYGRCFGSPGNSNKHEALDGAIVTDFLCCDAYKPNQRHSPNQEEVRRQHNGPADGDGSGHQPRDLTVPIGNETAKDTLNDIKISVDEV